MAQTVSFNRDIRPILAENCFYCHGQDANKRKANLRLDDRESVLSAKIVIPGDASASELIRRVHAADADEIMPPPGSNRRLSAEQKALLEKWIDEGAAFETHWAFVAPKRPKLPSHRDTSNSNAIDSFITEKLSGTSLAPSPPAKRPTLIRRLYADLIGLPPTPEEVNAFVEDSHPQAYERLIDRLLASPHYGERLALPWLDAARYADSNGFQQDGDTWQWIWRDWVVDALNDDLPFDDFTTWQLAGDLLPNATLDQQIASGFNRNHLLNGEGGAIPEEQRFVVLFDRMDTTATTWLGLTMACAQCHDHKYDPITMHDYYSLMDAFNQVPETGTPQRQSTRIRVAKPFVEVPTEENKARIAAFEKKIKVADEETETYVKAAFEGWRAAKPNGDRKTFDEKVRPNLLKENPAKKRADQLRRELANYKGDQIPRPMIMSDAKKRDTHILDRGAYLSPREQVIFATPAFLPPLADQAPKNRLGLAQWLLSPEQPLTARVQVNRMWQHFFGTGLVKTSEDFGVQSEFPLHGRLLDWLAIEFREDGWSQKAMHRLLLTTTTYQQSSRVTSQHLDRDPENRLHARASRFRMPSMLLRDWALASSGLLDRRISGQPVYPYQPDNVWEALAITKERDFTYPASSGADLYRRSLYTFWRRTVQPANMFDASSRQACRVRQSTNNTPLHALTTLNDPTWVEAARHLASRVMKTSDHHGQWLNSAFRLVLGRAPTTDDRRRLRRAFSKQEKHFAAHPADADALLAVGASAKSGAKNPIAYAALTAVCLAIFNFDESLTRE